MRMVIDTILAMPNALVVLIEGAHFTTSHVTRPMPKLRASVPKIVNAKKHERNIAVHMLRNTMSLVFQDRSIRSEFFMCKSLLLETRNHSWSLGVL